MIGIYKITNPKGKVYIGQSINIKRRFNQYLRLNNCKNQTKLYNSFKKYGVENHIFEVLEQCDEQFHLSFKEYHYQLLFNCILNGLNVVYVDPYNGTYEHTQQTKRKISESNKGKVFSIETRQKMSESAKNKIFTDEHKLNMSISKKGKIFSEEHKEKIKKSQLGENNSFYNKKHNLKSLQKIKQNSSKIILNLENGIYYESAKEAAYYYNLNVITLRQRLSGRMQNNTNLIYCE